MVGPIENPENPKYGKARVLITPLQKTKFEAIWFCLRLRLAKMCQMAHERHYQEGLIEKRTNRGTIVELFSMHKAFSELLQAIEILRQTIAVPRKPKRRKLSSC